MAAGVNCVSRNRLPRNAEAVIGQPREDRKNPGCPGAAVNRQPRAAVAIAVSPVRSPQPGAARGEGVRGDPARYQRICTSWMACGVARWMVNRIPSTPIVAPGAGISWANSRMKPETVS